MSILQDIQISDTPSTRTLRLIDMVDIQGQFYIFEFYKQRGEHVYVDEEIFTIIIDDTKISVFSPLNGYIEEIYADLAMLQNGDDPLITIITSDLNYDIEEYEEVLYLKQYIFEIKNESKCKKKEIVKNQYFGVPIILNYICGQNSKDCGYFQIQWKENIVSDISWKQLHDDYPQMAVSYLEQL